MRLATTLFSFVSYTSQQWPSWGRANRLWLIVLHFDLPSRVFINLLRDLHSQCDTLVRHCVGNAGSRFVLSAVLLVDFRSDFGLISLYDGVMGKAVD